MLSDRYRQLLTAYIDGELSSRQRRHVVRLLHRSPEARQLLEQLTNDARAVRRLPRPLLPMDFTSPVLQTITERGLVAGRRPTLKFDSANVWMGPLASWTAAAAVLLTLGIASYLYFISSLDYSAKMAISQKQPDLRAEDANLASAKNDDTRTEEAPEVDEATVDRHPPRETPKVVTNDGDKPKPSIADNPQPSAKKETALTGPVEKFQLERVPDLLLLTVKVSDLDRQPERAKLLNELGKDSAFRLELPCQNGSKAIDRVQNAARALNIGLIIDKQAQDRINRKWRISYALYLEDLTPAELTQFVRQIGAEDRKIAAGKALEAQIDWLVLTRMTAGHRKELATLLGIDPTREPSAIGSLDASDPRQPLSDVTARQVGRSLAGQGGTSQPESGRTAEHVALVLAYTPPVRSSAVSDEIKHFLESRKPARPGTVRVFLVLRG